MYKFDHFDINVTKKISIRISWELDKHFYEVYLDSPDSKDYDPVYFIGRNPRDMLKSIRLMLKLDHFGKRRKIIWEAFLNENLPYYFKFDRNFLCSGLGRYHRPNCKPLPNSIYE